MGVVRNPFILAGPVHWTQFAGRKSEAKAILDGLALPHRKMGFAVCGGPRSGKTSLLQYISSPEIAGRWGLATDHCTFIELNCQEIGPFTPAQFWQEAFSLMEDQLKADLKEHAKEHSQREKVTLGDLRRFFKQVTRKGTLIILVLDDFDAVAHEINHSVIRFLTVLRVLFSLRPQGLTVITTSCKPLSELFRGVRWPGGSPSYNFLHTFRLQPLQGDKVNELLEKTLRNTGVTFGEKEFAYIQRLAGGHPSLVQLAGWLLFESKAGRPVLDYAAITTEFNNQASAYFDELCQSCDELERKLLMKIVGVDDQTVYQLLEKHSGQANSLQNRGLIVKGKAGYELFSASFREWIYKNKDRLSEPLSLQSPVDIQQLREDWDELLLSRREGDAEQKGRALETFAAHMFQLIPGIKVRYRNLRSASEEIDILLSNESNHVFWRSNFETQILVECKNWNAPVGAEVIRDFHGKLEAKGIKAGFLVAMEGITGNEYKNAMLELRIYLRDRMHIIIPIDLEHLQRIVDGEDPTAVFQDAFYELYRI